MIKPQGMAQFMRDDFNKHVIIFFIKPTDVYLHESGLGLGAYSHRIG